MTNLRVDIQIRNDQFTFHGHIKYACTLIVPVHLHHFQRDVVAAVFYRQFVAEYIAIALDLIELVIFSVGNRIAGAGDRSVGGEFGVGRVDDAFAIREGGCADPHCNRYTVFLTGRA